MDYLYNGIAGDPKFSLLIDELAVKLRHQAKKFSANKGATTYEMEDYFWTAVEGIWEAYCKTLKGSKRYNKAWYLSKGISEMAHMARKDRNIKKAERGYAAKQGVQDYE